MNAITAIDTLMQRATPLPSLDEIRALVEQAKGSLAFGGARRLLEWARPLFPQEVWVVQQLALCTYKDGELPIEARLEEALNLLEQIGLRDPANEDAETLALGGAIYKRKWEAGGQLEFLHEALVFYRAAHERAPEQDLGYGGSNAAYLLDLLAYRAERIASRDTVEVDEAKVWRDRARRLREDIQANLVNSLERDGGLAGKYWFAVTLGEICLGLQQYAEAEEWLAKAAALPDVPEWQKQTTFRQLVSLARYQEIDLPVDRAGVAVWHPAWRALYPLLGEGTQRALSCYRGKVGLALSGGGFRASLFHLGVMARLAEMDVLRSVEVLSTVSGGSILGAHYYLEVRRLLQTKPDADITREDYIEIVRRVQERFLRGIESNIRMRAFGDFRRNLCMIFSKMLPLPFCQTLARPYTTSHRLGELYESELYAQVDDGHAPDQARNLPELLIKPAGAEAGPFKPAYSNWRRRAKVPVLLLNATTLNSGHNWQFTARSMGEPPGLLGTEGDMNVRYRRVYYEDTPSPELRKYRLGYAVAASACVPGLFDPLAIDGLYEGRVVRLVDGGVHDNQGVAGLLDEGCTVILCSDASGQMADVKTPSDDPAGVLLRASSILQARVREAEYQDLCVRLDSHALEGLFFVHTKKELETKPLDWIGCHDQAACLPDTGNATSYGVDRDLQAKIAGIRTDLDSFTEVEAHSLMASGYRMTARQFEVLQRQHLADGNRGFWGGYQVDAAEGEWPFRVLEPILKKPVDDPDPRRHDLGLQLEVAGQGFFKAWRLVPRLKHLAWILGGAGLVLLVLLLVMAWNQIAFAVTWGALVLGILILLAGFIAPALRWLSPDTEARSLLLKIAVAFGGYLMAKIHLGWVDRQFLERGRLARLLDLK